MLTVKSVRTLGPGRHHDGPPLGRGLYLQVKASGARSWLYIYMRDRRQRFMGLGRADTISLHEAREAALAARRLLVQGVDPIDHRRQNSLKATAQTFRQFAEDYITAQMPGWRNGGKSAGQWRSSLATYAYPVIGDLGLGAVTVDHVIRILPPIWATKPETANRVRTRVAAILDAAKARGLRSGDNPAEWRGNLKHLLPAPAKVRRVDHHAALPYAELPAFMKALRGREGVAARALEFAILTAARTSEVLGATWPEIDIKARTWTVPAERMKAGKAHVVPLSDRALAILEALPREERNDFVFVGSRANGGLSSMAFLMLLRRMGRDDLTAHGFRSSFRDWASEETDAPNHVVEMALAHAIGDKVEAAYRRGVLFEKRKALMATWAEFAG
jgi:integrase